ncbi:MAG TPA: hypothetical protein VIH89_17110 [Candidatus Sulfotelmatobacter sp.]
MSAAMLAFLLAAGCSRSPMLGAENGNSSADRPGVADSQADKGHVAVPFHGQEADSEKAMAVSSSASVPFAASSGGVLPVGTLLTVRVRDSVSNAKPDSGTRFVASVQDPILIDGNLLVARGAVVRGQLESARSSGVGGNRSYLRLTLVSIEANGQEVPLQTSSLFTRGATSMSATQAAFSPTAVVAGEGSHLVHLPKGRFLTFRLSSPVALPWIGSTHLSKGFAPSGD